MDLREFLRVLRKNWLVLVVVTLLGGVGGVWAAFATHAQYRSTTLVYLRSTGANSSLATEYSSGLTMAQRVASYVQLVSSPLVSQAVANELGRPELAGPITGELSGSQPTATYFIRVTVTDRSATRAQTIADAFGKVFGGVVNRVESGQVGGASPFTFTVVQPASFNPHAVSPNRRLDFALGLMLGFVVALLLAMLRHVLDRSVTSSAVLSELGLPVLAVVPADRRAHRRQLAGGADDDRRAEAYRQLRTGLQFAMAADASGRVLVVTSAGKAEGKTATAANLAVTMARAGARVALVDADLRKPSLAQMFGRVHDQGLTNVLLGQSPLGDVEQTVGDADLAGRLSLVAAGPAVANPSELLGSTAMARVLADLAARYDYVVMDAPAVLPVTDAAVLGALSDRVVLAVRYARTQRPALGQALQLLRQVGAQVAGAVFTMVPAGSDDAARFDERYKPDASVVETVPADLRPATSHVPSEATDGQAAVAAGPRTRTLRTRTRTGPPDVS